MGPGDRGGVCPAPPMIYGTFGLKKIPYKLLPCRPLQRFNKFNKPWGGILRLFELCFKSVVTNLYSENHFNSVVTFVL